MLERAVEMPPDLVRRSDDGVTHDAGLACRVQLVVLEVRPGIGRLVLAVQEADRGLLAGQLWRRSSGAVVAGSFVDHEGDDWLICALAHHPTWTRAPRVLRLSGRVRAGVTVAPAQWARVLRPLGREEAMRRPRAREFRFRPVRASLRRTPPSSGPRRGSCRRPRCRWTNRGWTPSAIARRSPLASPRRSWTARG